MRMYLSSLGVLILNVTVAFMFALGAAHQITGFDGTKGREQGLDILSNKVLEGKVNT